MRPAQAGWKHSLAPGHIMSVGLLLLSGLGILAPVAGPYVLHMAWRASAVTAPMRRALEFTLAPTLLIGLSLMGLLLAATLIRRAWRRAQHATYQAAWRAASHQATSVVLEQVRMLEHAHLKSAVVEAQALLEAARNARDGAQQALHLQETAHSLNRLRRLTTELHGNVSQATDQDAAVALPTDLERTLREVTQNYRALVSRCTLEVLGVPAQTIPANMRAALVMGLYNALTNAHTHGHAQAVRVRLEYRLADVTLSIHDNGCGFDVAETRARTPGRGIRDLFTLTEQQGGTVTITSVQGQGTDVTITLPLARPLLGWAADLRQATLASTAPANAEDTHATLAIHSPLAPRHPVPGGDAEHSGGRRHGDRAGSGMRSAEPPWLRRDSGGER